MAVFRVEKNKNYTVMSNHHLKEKEMSLKAKGLLSVMLSLPEDWDFTINGLVAICKENETAVKSTLNELKKFGYLKVDKLTPKQTESGRFEYIYNIFEMPKQERIKQGLENLCLESLPLEVLSVENQGQLNTNKLNTNKSNIEELNINNIKKESKKATDYDLLINNYTSNADLKGEIMEFIKMRKLIKKPMTNQALTLTFSKLNEYGKTDEEKIKILQNSIMNCWQGVFPLKEELKPSFKAKNEPSNYTAEDIARYNRDF